jgi:hypothetical protein
MEHCSVNTTMKGEGGYQVKLPVKATNRSREFAPAAEIPAVTITKPDRKMFFFHLMYGFCLPDRSASPVPFSRIRMAGNNCRGVDNNMAREYKNCTAFTNARDKSCDWVEVPNLSLEVGKR